MLGIQNVYDTCTRNINKVPMTYTPEEMSTEKMPGDGLRRVNIKLPEVMITKIKQRGHLKGNGFSAEVRETLWQSLEGEKG